MKMVKATGLTKVTTERLELLSKSNTVSLQEVTAKFIEHRTKDSLDERTALLATINDYRRTKQFQSFAKNRKQKEVSTLYGFIVGTRGIWDKAETIRRKAKSIIDKQGMQAAQEQGFIDGENHILDTRDKIYGRPNADYGKPLPEGLHVLDLMLYGYFRHNGDKLYKWGTIQTSNNALARGWDKDIIQKARWFSPCQVSAIIDFEDKTDITLRATTMKESPSVFKGLSEKLDIKAIIDKSTKFTPLKDVEHTYEMVKGAWDRFVAVKGVVTNMNLDRPDALGRVTVSIMNPENEDETLRIRVNPTLTEIDFGELSEIYVFGKPERSMYRDRETGKLEDGDVVVDAFGIYPVTKTPKASSLGESTSDDDVVSGWLE
jgi:hypothetical protein